MILFCYSFVKICSHKLYILMVLCLHELMPHVLSNWSLENGSSHKFHIGMLYFLHELKPCVLSSQWYLPTFYIGLEPTLIYIGLGPRLLSPMNWYYVSIQKNHKLSIQMAFFPSWAEALCSFKLEFFMKLVPQVLHWKSFFPSWTESTLAFKLSFLSFKNW